MGDAEAAVAHRRAAPGDDLIADLVRTQAEDGDWLNGAEVVTLVWHLVLAGQTPATMIANSVETLVAHPEQLTALRDDPRRMPARSKSSCAGQQRPARGLPGRL